MVLELGLEIGTTRPLVFEDGVNGEEEKQVMRRNSSGTSHAPRTAGKATGAGRGVGSGKKGGRGFSFALGT